MACCLGDVAYFCATKEFHQLESVILMKALKELEKQGKAKVHLSAYFFTNKHFGCSAATLSRLFIHNNICI